MPIPVRRRARTLLMVTLAFVIASMSLPAVAATPTHEITARWVDPPETIGRGNPVVAEWRVNLNDAEEPPTNEPGDDVTATFTLDKAFFDDIPDMCLTDGVTDASVISDDGRTLTCNFGTVPMGTAIVVQTAVVADGLTGEEITANGEIGDASTALPPIPIENPFDMDMYWGNNYGEVAWNEDSSAVDMSLQWNLRLGTGSEPGPERVEYTLRLATIDGSPVEVGTNPVGLTGCTRFDIGTANGHPNSTEERPATDPQNTRFVDSCTLTEVSPGVFRLVLEGIDYSVQNLPTHDSNNNPLPPEWGAVASGSLWFRVVTESAGSLQLTMDPVTYTSSTGLTDGDNNDNNATNQSYTRPGSWAGSWRRAYTNSGGTYWDDTYRVSVGTVVQQASVNRYYGDVPADPQASTYGGCVALDTRFVRLEPSATDDGSGVLLWGQLPGVVYEEVEAGTVEYYVGGSAVLDPASGSYDPDQFSCAGSGGWTTSLPADADTVRAVRISYPHSTFAEANVDRLNFYVHTTVREEVEIGQDIWTFASVLRDGVWAGPGQGSAITETPDARYPNTTSRRDILRIIGATPVIRKAAAEESVTPGVPVDFTLTYAATGSDAIPAVVDDYEVTDALPVGMTYVTGSADTEPEVSVDNEGRQVLVWQLDGVETNTNHRLGYQAVADASVTPGTQLTNTAQSSYGGLESSVARETVTITTNGYTAIIKTSDVSYIPNDAGDGVGSGSWTVTIESHDPLPQSFTDTIDILPYQGDGRGTSFSGTYALDAVTADEGGTVYYTSADPASLVDDPADPSNGAAGNPDGNSVGWTTERPEKVTAVRVIGGQLLPGESFSFQIVITTDGAEPEDAYVNRAQARAEHTALVMRTSAVLVVTAYDVVKSSDPASGSDVRPGQKISYTVLVTQRGSVPAGAVLTDDLSAVLDDATYNDDVTASAGEVSVDGTTLSWSGELPVGGSATITYSVTVNDPAALRADGDTELRNQVNSPGCAGECSTTHQVGLFEHSKTAVVAPGSTVHVGEVINYTVTVSQVGAGAVEGASIDDDLSGVLDDATYNGDATASSGEVSVDGTTLAWSGDLTVGQEVTITYSVTTTEVGEGDDRLDNQVSTEDDRGRCVPAADGNPDCRTSHVLGDFTYAKTAVAAPGSTVESGDVVTYTVTVTHIGSAEVAGAVLVDDLTDVLDDASWNDDAAATSGTLERDGTTLRWTGDLASGNEVTISYSVTVDPGADHLRNVVASGDDRGTCVPAADGNADCVTEHPVEPPSPAAPADPPASPPLAQTGAPLVWGSIATGLGLLVAGATALGVARRRVRG